MNLILDLSRSTGYAVAQDYYSYFEDYPEDKRISRTYIPEYMEGSLQK